MQGQYPYTGDLLELASMSIPTVEVPPWQRYHTPMRTEKLAPFMARNPDVRYATYILDGLNYGFRIGYDPRVAELHTRGVNHPPALAKMEVVDERIRDELAASRLLEPLPPDLAPLVHVSPMGLVPKPYQPGSLGR
jgi:hypothetical protein